MAIKYKLGRGQMQLATGVYNGRPAFIIRDISKRDPPAVTGQWLEETKCLKLRKTDVLIYLYDYSNTFGALASLDVFQQLITHMNRKVVAYRFDSNYISPDAIKFHD